MPRLPADEFRAWKAAFNDAFTTRDDLNSVVYSAMSQTLDQLALGDNLPAIIEKLIWKASDEDWLDELIAAAREKRPNHQALARLHEQPRVISALESSDHFEATYLLGQPLVNRRHLRDVLKQLDAGDEPRVLVIDGDPVSGKTYSSRFINYLAGKRKTFKVAKVDLERLARGEGGPVRPATVARSIVSQWGLDGMPEPGQEQDSTWVDLFCDWLTGVLGSSPTNCWIVIDGFGKALVAQGTHDLVEQLGLRSYENLPALRLVLVSYKKLQDLRALVGPNVEYEWIARIGRDELTTGLVQFFGLVYLERQDRRGLPDDQAQLQPLMIESANRVLDKVRDDDPNRLLELSWAVAEETRRINTAANGQAAGPGGGNQG